MFKHLKYDQKRLNKSKYSKTFKLTLKLAITFFQNKTCFKQVFITVVKTDSCTILFKKIEETVQQFYFVKFVSKHF
jgi:hypothetical protein